MSLDNSHLLNYTEGGKCSCCVCGGIMPLIPRASESRTEFQARQGYIGRACLKNQNKPCVPFSTAAAWRLPYGALWDRRTSPPLQDYLKLPDRFTARVGSLTALELPPFVLAEHQPRRTPTGTQCAQCLYNAVEAGAQDKSTAPSQAAPRGARVSQASLYPRGVSMKLSKRVGQAEASAIIFCSGLTT